MKRLNRFFKELKYWFCVTPKNCKRVIQYIPLIWKDRDWDHLYFLEMMKFKLNRMRELFSDPDRHMIIESDAKKIAKQISMCITLINRIREDDYDPPFAYERTKTVSDVVKSYNVVHSSNMMKQDMELLTEILRKHLFSWWD